MKENNLSDTSIVKTINVIKIQAGFFVELKSFTDTEEGNFAAQKYFINSIEDEFGIKLDGESIDDIILEKEYNQNGNGYQLAVSV